MIDALLYGVRDSLRDPANGLGYDYRTCCIGYDGHPPPRCGDVFVSVHQLPTRSLAINSLDEYFAFACTLTMRCSNVPYDRIGEQLLAKQLAAEVARETGFNVRANQIATFLHQNWGILQLANDYLVKISPDATLVYGFAEPAMYQGTDLPVLVGGEWFMAEASTNVALMAMIRFDGARRLQAIASYS